MDSSSEKTNFYKKPIKMSWKYFNSNIQENWLSKKIFKFFEIQEKEKIIGLTFSELNQILNNKLTYYPKEQQQEFKKNLIHQKMQTEKQTNKITEQMLEKEEKEKTKQQNVKQKLITFNDIWNINLNEPEI